MDFPSGLIPDIGCGLERLVELEANLAIRGSEYNETIEFKVPTSFFFTFKFLQLNTPVVLLSENEKEKD